RGAQAQGVGRVPRPADPLGDGALPACALKAPTRRRRPSGRAGSARASVCNDRSNRPRSSFRNRLLAPCPASAGERESDFTGSESPCGELGPLTADREVLFWHLVVVQARPLTDRGEAPLRRSGS